MAFRLRPELKFTNAKMTSEQKRAIDAETFRAVLQPWLSNLTGHRRDLQEARNHYDAEFDRLVAKVRLDGAIHEPVQVDDRQRLIKNFRLLDAAILLADEGKPEILGSLRVERVTGFLDNHEINTYLRAVVLSAHRPTRSEQRALTIHEIAQDEVRYQTEIESGGEAHRSSYNLIAARLGVSYHLVARVESESFPNRSRPYELGQEKRLDTNGVPKAKRDRESPSAVQAIANLFGGASTESLETLTLEKLEEAYKGRKKDLDPEFVTDSEIGKAVASYEFLKEEIEKRTPETNEDAESGSSETNNDEEEEGLTQDEGAEGDERGLEGAEGEDGSGGERDRREDGDGPPAGVENTNPEAFTWLTPEAIAELREEADRFAEERAAIEDYFNRKDRPFTAGLLSAFLDEGLIEVEEHEGRRVIRDWTLGDLRDFGGVVASLSPLESSLRDLGVTPEIARRHLLAMIVEARGYERSGAGTKRKPATKSKSATKSSK